jgi:4-hydroxy-2-oxoheptanedioate aldolase
MPRINKAIELLSQCLPVFYTNTGELTFENGKQMAGTWADMIRLDLEHPPFDPAGIGEFMRGLIAGGPTASGHLTPAVIAALPTDGTDEQVMRANAWMIKQALAQGIHGFLLCHAETPGAARVLVESSRFSHQFTGVGPNLGIGRRGNGPQKIAAPLWGVSVSEYFQKADVWPVNPDGEILLGLKIENPRAVANVDQTLAVPGIGFAEWGPGDNGMALGDPEAHDPPYSPVMTAIRERVKNACKANGVFFLDMMLPNDIEARIDEGVMIGGAPNAEVAEKARTYARIKRATECSG